MARKGYAVSDRGGLRLRDINNAGPVGGVRASQWLRSEAGRHWLLGEASIGGEYV